MIGWRRRAKAARETTVSQERLYELVNQTLMENFGPLGSFAITRRSAADSDDIFHTSLARSVARDIVANLAEHGITVRSSLGHAAAPLAPLDAVYVPRQLARAVSSSAPVAPIAPLTLTPAALGPDPQDDDALRSLVAHHREVEAAAAQKSTETSTEKTTGDGWAYAR
ncbi:hypothetical protein [Herbiconiux liukaitaii]|uniref:hypothetical protein n=1 Tax=Herbiconiux liukaitaii TaxID=3342799 RepID=UPI0035B9E933